MTKTTKQSEKLTKYLSLSLLVILALVFLLYKFKALAPVPECNLRQPTNFKGQQMWDFAIKNSVFFRSEPEQAACWFEKSAESGFLNAFGSIARAYENGNGVEQSYEQAIKWHTKGMALNNNGSYYLLGRMYEEGRGVNRNIQKAIELYRKAAALKNGGAKKRLEILQK
jgi:TPR repeat protein